MSFGCGILEIPIVKDVIVYKSIGMCMIKRLLCMSMLFYAIPLSASERAEFGNDEEEYVYQLHNYAKRWKEVDEPKHHRVNMQATLPEDVEVQISLVGDGSEGDNFSYVLAKGTKLVHAVGLIDQAKAARRIERQGGIENPGAVPEQFQSAQSGIELELDWLRRRQRRSRLPEISEQPAAVQNSNQPPALVAAGTSTSTAQSGASIRQEQASSPAVSPLLAPVTGHSRTALASEAAIILQPGQDSSRAVQQPSAPVAGQPGIVPSVVLSPVAPIGVQPVIRPAPVAVQQGFWTPTKVVVGLGLGTFIAIAAAKWYGNRIKKT